MMTPDRWREIKPVLEAAIALPPEAREAFLERECSGDAMRIEVRSIIASYESSPGRFETPAAAVLSCDEPTARKIANRIEQYEIVHAIGSGGMGEVYLAIDNRLGRKVALKVLPAELTRDPERVSRLMQEARTASALNHPNIVTVHELGLSGELNFIAEEYVEGVTLRERIRAGPMPPDEAVGIALQVASALQAAHAAGVIHRDIKPENIMIRGDGLVKVLDFGLAKFLSGVPPGAAQMETAAGLILGTVHYMSPEQARGTPVDVRSDLWSLGVVLYEMLAQQRPFEAPTASDVLMRILQPDPPSMSGIATPAMREILLGALAKDREQRYQSASELAGDLKSYRASGSVVERATSRRRAIAAPMAHLSSRFLRTVVVLGVVAMIAIVGYRAVAPSRDVTALPRPAPRIASVALLPITFDSEQPEEQSIAKGVTWELQRELEAADSLRVITQGSVREYVESKKPVADMGRELGVTNVVSGSIARVGDRFRLTATLTNVRSGKELWTQSYDTTLADLIRTESEIAYAVARTLDHSGAAPDRRLTSGRAPVNAEAHAVFLKAMGGATPMERRSGFERAIEIDPKFAPALTMLARSYVADAWFNQAVSPMVGYPKAKEYALRALAIDDSDSSSHAMVAVVKLHHEWDWAGAESEFRRALELSPSDATAHHIYSHYLLTMDRLGESVAESRIASDLSPLDPGLSTCVGWHCLYARQYDDAIAQCMKLVTDDQASGITYYYLGRVYVRQGKIEPGIAALEIAQEKSAGANAVLATLAYAYGRAGRRADAERVLAVLKERAKTRYVPAFDIAVVYSGLGETEHTFDWLDRAFLERSTWLVHLKWDDRFSGYRRDPRMTALLRRMGIPNPGSVREPETIETERFVTSVAGAR